MMKLAPEDQENDRIPRGATIAVACAVVLLSALFILVARFELELRRSTLTHASMTATSPRPAAEVSGVRSALFREPGAGELLVAQQRAVLGSFAWVDASRGVVRIPIDVAIELELKEQR